MQTKKIKIMGILNVTPDSFSDGGMYLDPQKALERAKEMLSQGADIIDVGGESTRPGSETIAIDEELKRVIPVVEGIKKELPDATISIDSYRAEVVEEALEAGATMVNSLGGFLFDKKLAEVVARFGVPMVIYHIKGQPKTMQSGEIVYNDVLGDINDFFEEHIAFGLSKGMKREQFILDLGIGFGKTVEQNVAIIRRFDEFQKFDLPLLIGVSRKSHLGKFLQDKLKFPTLPSPTERLEGALAETAVAVQKGATIVRTHDVLETKKFLVMLEALL